MSKPDAQRVADLREAIASVEQEPCSCRYIGYAQSGGGTIHTFHWHLATLKCIRCQHLKHLREELREAEGAR